MIRIQTHQESGIIAIKASEKLNQQDFDKLAPKLREFINSNQKPQLLMILERFKGWEDVNSFWKDLKLDAEFIGKFNRIAIIGQSKWQKWATNLLDTLTKEKLKFFGIQNADNAWAWLQNKKPVS